MGAVCSDAGEFPVSACERPTVAWHKKRREKSRRKNLKKNRQFVGRFFIPLLGGRTMITPKIRVIRT
jgi:hypothetical protein